MLRANPASWKNVVVGIRSLVHIPSPLVVVDFNVNLVVDGVEEGGLMLGRGREGSCWVEGGREGRCGCWCVRVGRPPPLLLPLVVVSRHLVGEARSVIYSQGV